MVFWRGLLELSTLGRAHSGLTLQTKVTSGVKKNRAQCLHTKPRLVFFSSYI